MKTLKWSLLVVLVAGVASLMVMVLTRSPRSLATNGKERNQPVVYQPSPLGTVPVRKLVSTVPLRPEKTDVPAAEIGSEAANVMRVRADRVLAKVNDQAIVLRDLVPLRADEQEQAMTPEEYESRLNRAIEMELTFQAAVAQGVDLTPEQQEQVDGIAQRHAATLQEFREQGVTWSSVTPAQVEFEQRLTSALLLQQNLVALEAHVAPSADSRAQMQYEQARSEILSRFEASGTIMVSTAEF